MTNGHFEYISIPRCGVMPSVNDNKTDKKKRLLESAFELFLDKSVNSTAVDDVVKGAGVAKGTFYIYFKDKYDLLNQLVAHKSGSAFIKAYEVAFADEDADFEDKMLLLVNNIIDFLAANREFTALLQKNLAYCFRKLIGGDDPAIRSAVLMMEGELEKRGYTAEEAGKALYLIAELTGSTCCNAIILGSPYGIDEIRGFLCETVRNLLRKENREI